MKPVGVIMETIWRFLEKLNIESPFDPAVPLLGIWSQEMKSL